MEAGCKRVDVEAKRYGAPEVWRRAVGVATWRCEAVEAHCRCTTRRYGGMDAGCKRAGVEVWSSGALEVRFRRVEVEA